MKKFLFSCLLVSVAIGALAVLPTQFIRLRQFSNVIGMPTIRPVSVDDEPALTCIVDEDELVVISNTLAGVVNITIIAENGTEIVHEVLNMAAGAEYILALDALPAGTYTLYISCAQDCWYGDFEVE